jgi:small conductance mechanosensitive channel
MDASFAPQNLDALAAMLWTWGVDFLPRLIAAIAIIVLGVLLSRWTTRLTFGIAERATHVDPTIEPVLRATVRYAILILVAIAALSQLGVQTASLLAVLGTAGLAIGLALQSTLSNIAAGIMLLWLRPFRIGDLIEVISGTPFSGMVKEIGLFACLIEAPDGTHVFAPNSTLWNVALRNHSRGNTGLVSFSVEVSDKADLDKARQVILETATNDGRVLKTPLPSLNIDSLENGDFRLTCRLWTTPASALALRQSMVSLVRRRFATTPEDAQYFRGIRDG